MVHHAYALSGTGELDAGQQQAVVEVCIDFDQGSLAWYLHDHIRRGTPVDRTNDEAQGLQASTRRLSSSYLQLALARCIGVQADEQACLRLLRLASTDP